MEGWKSSLDLSLSFGQGQRWLVEKHMQLNLL